MPLSTVRNMLVESTGRQDLLDAGMAVGADTLINQGQRLLDRRLDGSKSGARYVVDIDAGDILVPIHSCRAIKKVFLYSATERVELVRWDMHSLRAKYAEPKTLLASGRPIDYAPIWCRPYPEYIDPALFLRQWAFDDVVTSGHYQFNAIVVMPPADVPYTIEVFGLFYSDTLVSDADESYWTEDHPLLLVQAAMWHLEASYRNTEGQKDLMATIDLIMTDITKDIIEEDIEGKNVMEG